MLQDAATLKRTAFSFSGFAAILAGFLYSSRWAWEISEGILKNMYYPSSLLTQNFFVVKLLFIIVLLALLRQVKTGTIVRFGLLAAIMGLTWTSITRTIEAYGASGPWGLLSSPGLLLFLAGLFTTGILFLKNNQQPLLGKVLVTIAALSFLGSLSSLLFFNLLGRDLTANLIASVIANIFLITEGIGWILLGIMLWKRQVSPDPGSPEII